MNKQIIISVLISAATILLVQKFRYQSVIHDLPAFPPEGAVIKGVDKSPAKSAGLETLPLNQVEKKYGKMQNIRAISLTNSRIMNKSNNTIEMNLECFNSISSEEPAISEEATRLQN